MTNEQLAILIRNYVQCLDELIKKLDAKLPENIERHLAWVRKDGQPFSPMEAWHAKDDPDFEQVSTGKCVCLDDLRQFSVELWTQINELSATEKLNAIKRTRRLR